MNRGWKKVDRGKWHYFNNFHSLCWRWESAADRFSVDIPDPADQCAVCKHRLGWRRAHSSQWKAMEASE